MNTALFFDDQRLVNRVGLARAYGEPIFIPDSVYFDPQNSASGGLPSVWRDDHATFHLFYQAFTPAHKTYALAAISDDGIHWTPRDTAAGMLDGYDFPNQLLPTDNAELACVYHDEHGDRSERLKAFVARYRPETLTVEDLIYVSADGLRWKRKEGIAWSDRGAEPGAGCVYSKALGKHIIVARAGWGMRRLCVHETPDFEHFEPSRVALQVDSLDEPNIETYGMPSFAYKGWYVGLLWLYHTPSEDHWKYMGGTLDCQLAYSVNGSNWFRSLRTPFIGNDLPQAKGMVFPAALRSDENGDILITASATPHQHGYFKEGGGCILTYRLRQDGFIRLVAGDAPGHVCTRELLLQKGGITVNITCKEATVAVLDHDYNPIAGYGHEDCRPFSGDSIAWQPRYRSGHSIADLTGRVIVLDIRLAGGSLYAYAGDFVHLLNTQAARYVKFGAVPDTRGF